MLTQFIFDVIHKYTKGLVHLCAIDTREGKFRNNLVSRDKEEVGRWVESNIGSYDLFFSLCTFKDDSSRKAINAKEVACVHADMDFKDYEGGKDRADQLIIDFINHYGPRPTAIVHSGYGYHVYWVLKEPFIIETDGDRRSAAETIQTVQKQLQADSTRDLARIYRIPSTLNRKYGKEVEAVRIDHPMAKGQEYSWATFRKIVKKIKKDEVDRDFGEIDLDTSWTQKKCVQKILSKDIQEGERNKAFLRVASELKKIGRTKEYVINYVLNFNSNLNTPFSNESVLRLVDDCFVGAYDFGCNDPYLKEHCSEDCLIKGSLYTNFETLEPFSIDSLMKELEGHKGKKIIGMSTEIEKLDEATDGIRGLWVIGGPSKCNKSTFVMDLAIKQALRGTRVLLIDRELSEKVVVTRILSYLWGRNVEEEAKVGIDKTSEDFQQALTTLKTLQPQFKILSSRCPSKDEISNIAASVLEQGETILIAVDSLNKLKLQGLAPSRREAIDEWLLFFEDLSKNTKCPILLVSEVTKAAWDNPKAGDFAESRQHDYACSTSLMLTKEGERRTLKVCEARHARGGEIIEFRLPTPFAWRLEEVG